MNDPTQTRVLVTGGASLGRRSCYDEGKRCAELTRSRSRIVFKELPYDDPTRRRPDISLATAELSGRPSVPLFEGIKQTIDYFDDLLAAAPPVREALAPGRKAS